MQFPPRNRLLAAASLALSLTIASACASTGMAGSSADGEARLAAMLEGRTAGEPQSCISATLDSRLTIIDETAVVYDAGSTIYVARPANPQSLDDRDVLVIERTGGRLCKQDVVRTIDSTLGYTTGAVFLGDFVPYE